MFDGDTSGAGRREQRLRKQEAREQYTGKIGSEPAPQQQREVVAATPSKYRKFLLRTLSE